MKRSKRYEKARQLIDKNRAYTLEEGLKLLKEIPAAAFDESVDIAINLGVNPKYSDQMVKGSVKLPNGTGKRVRILVFAKGEKEKEAIDAGADIVGGEELIEKIKGGFMEFDKTIATPDIMSSVSKIGKILGPRGLMPNPKMGTVTFDIAKAIMELRAGKIEFKIDKAGIVHTIVGKKSFDENKLKENILTLLEALIKLKPSTSKGVYLRGITISTTMGPGIKLDMNDINRYLRS